MNTNPPCSTWQAWLGPEVEGSRQLGERTLFVRSGDVKRLLDQYPSVRRVWLCKEYLYGHSREELWTLAVYLHDRAIELAVELMVSDFQTYAVFLREYAFFYIKVPFTMLRPGDHICVGPAFSDEAFQIGTGSKVVPTDYLKDERIH